MSLTLRNQKGEPLTYSELDNNFVYLSSSYVPTSSFEGLQTNYLTMGASSTSITSSAMFQSESVITLPGRMVITGSSVGFWFLLQSEYRKTNQAGEFPYSLSIRPTYVNSTSGVLYPTGIDQRFNVTAESNATLYATLIGNRLYRTGNTDSGVNNFNSLVGMSQELAHQGDISTGSYSSFIQGSYEIMRSNSGIVANMYGNEFNFELNRRGVSQPTVVTNLCGTFSRLFVGLSNTASLTNYYHEYVNAPAVGVFGTILNRWGLYFIDPLTNSYHAGSVLIGSEITNGSAKLQVDSTSQGFLPPRMTSAQRTAIVSPSVGLMVYQTDSTEGLYVYKSTGWTFVA